MLLRELEGRSHDEIALALGITSGAARQHVMRARVALRAAASAVTPYPLISHLATSLAQGPTAAATGAEILGGTGVGAIAIKLTAGVAATGALVSALAVPVIRSDAPPTRRTPPAVAAQHDDAVRADDPKPSVAIVHATRAVSATAGRARGRPTATRAGSTREDHDEDESDDEDRHGTPVRGDGSDHDEDGEDRRSGGDEDREADHGAGTADDAPEHASSSGSGPDSRSSDSAEPAEDPSVSGTDEAVLDAEPETRSAESTTTESHDGD